jgi:hypothetical protein
MATEIIDFEEKRLEKLHPREVGRYLMRLPAGKRIEAILQRMDAEAVVSALPEQDFFFTIKDIGPDDSLPLLALSRTNQLNHLFDMEWWQKDRVMPAKAAEWLERLSRANDRKLLAWLYQADFELLVTLFKKWIRVSTAPEDIDLVEAREQLPLHSLDEQYFWESFYPQYEQVIKHILEILFEVNYGFYVELMKSVIWSIDIESEEEAYRFHRGRLEDMAVPDYYDALDIYRSIRPNEVPYDKEPYALLSAESSPAPSFAVTLLHEKDLLSRALQEIEDVRLLDSLQIELAALANKVVVADQLSIDDRDALREAIVKTAAHVNLGLDLQSGGDVNAALPLLREVHLEYLFRLGQTQITRLRSRLQRVCRDGWISRWPTGIHILDAQWMDAADLLLQRTPKLLRPRSDSKLPPHEDFFHDKTDLLRGNHLIDVIGSLGPVFDALHPRHDEIRDNLWQEGQITTVEDVTLGALLWTSAARFQLEGNWRPEPLHVRAWPGLFPRLEPQALEETIRSWIAQTAPQSSSHVSVRAYLNPLFKAYTEEVRTYYENQHSLDPGMVKHFLFAKA